MKIRLLVCLSLLVVCVCVASAPAQAQDSKVDVFGGYSYGTNSFSCNFGFACADPGLQGYDVAATYNFNNHIGLEANFSGHNGTTTVNSYPATSSAYGETDLLSQDIYTYTFGPKISLPIGHFTLYTHFLVGGTHVHEGYTDKCIPGGGEYSSCFATDSGRGSANGMAFKTGGGVDWNRGRWGIRILEVDYIHSELSGTGTFSSGGTLGAPETSTGSGNSFELATGITFHFGMK